MKLRQMAPGDEMVIGGLQSNATTPLFVEPIANTLSTVDPNRDNFVILLEQTIVGFFQVDHRSCEQKIPGDLELHEVQIHHAYRNQGLGQAFVKQLPELLRATYPGYRTICLTVNCKNHRAYRVYESGGFIDTGELYMLGRSGPQHIMRLEY